MHIWRAGMLVSLWLSLAGAAVADPPVPADRGIDWVRRPMPRDFFSLLPSAVLVPGVNGQAVLECTVTALGVLENCRVTSETPPGVGFGPAALAMSEQFVFRPAIHNGLAVSSSVRIPVTFPAGMLVRGATSQHLALNIPWTEAPTLADLAAAFPMDARHHRIGGLVSLSCVISRGGRLHHCYVMNQEPRFEGFDQAAQRLSSRFRAPVEQPSLAPFIGMRTVVRFNFPVEALDPARWSMDHANWLAQPHGDIPGSGYPRAAATAGITSALVHLRCVVAADGHLTGCIAVDEDPPGYGFAAAATALSTGFVMRLWSDGLPTVGASVTIPVRYTLPTRPPAGGR